MTTQVGIS